MKTYDRLPNETDAQWLAFVTYRDMGDARSIDTAYQLYIERRSPEKSKKATGSASSSFKRWIAENNWADRVNEFDRDREAEKREVQSEADREKYLAELEHYQKMQIQSGKAGVAIAVSAKNMLVNFLKKMKQIKTLDEAEKLARVIANVEEKSLKQWERGLSIEKLIEFYQADVPTPDIDTPQESGFEFQEGIDPAALEAMGSIQLR